MCIRDRIIAAIGINNQQQSPKKEAEKVLKESVEKVKDATKDGFDDAKKKLEAAGGN